MWVLFDRSDGSSRPVELRDHYDQISAVPLHAGVPEDVSLQLAILLDDVSDLDAFVKRMPLCVMTGSPERSC